MDILDNQVVRTRWNKNNGKFMVEVGAVNAKSVHRFPKAKIFHYRRWGLPPKRKSMEFVVSHDAVLESGTKLTARHFVPGQYVDAQGLTIGKGFAGAMKRWGFKGQPASHGHSKSHRSLGSTGNIGDAKTIKGKKMHGRMGGKNSTVQSNRIIKIDYEYNLLYMKGQCPGHDDAYIRVTDAIKKGWHKQTFPDVERVPMPTWIEERDDVGGRNVAGREVYVEGYQEGKMDPLSRPRRELMSAGA
ncbi:54S ribosomal protein L3 [Rhizophlyctis rosea]|nr:54S ribosomal protein L3 [Rhizophlyctis rosea]